MSHNPKSLYGYSKFRLWIPSLLGSKLLLWLDFSDLNSMTLIDNKISAINDKSLNSRIFSQSNSLNRPTYTQNGAVFLRGLDCLFHQFNSLTFPNGIFANNPLGFRVFATVINETESGGAGGVLITESQYTSDSRPFFTPLCKSFDGVSSRNRIAGLYRTNTSGSFLITTTSTRSNVISLSTTEYNLISSQDTLTTYRNFTNTVQSNETNYTRTGSITPTNVCSIGAYARPIEFATTGGWVIRDIVVTDNTLTNQELDRVNGYCAWNSLIKHKLPSNHQFFNSPPII